MAGIEKVRSGDFRNTSLSFETEIFDFGKLWFFTTPLSENWFYHLSLVALRLRNLIDGKKAKIYAVSRKAELQTETKTIMWYKIEILEQKSQKLSIDYMIISNDFLASF